MPVNKVEMVLFVFTAVAATLLAVIEATIAVIIGAIIFGMEVPDLTHTAFAQDWFQVFLGALPLIAVIFNNVIRKRVTGER